MFTAIKEEYYTAKKTNFSFRDSPVLESKTFFPHEVFTTAIVFPSSLGDGPAGHYG